MIMTMMCNTQRDDSTVFTQREEETFAIGDRDVRRMLGVESDQREVCGLDAVKVLDIDRSRLAEYLAGVDRVTVERPHVLMPELVDSRDVADRDANQVGRVQEFERELSILGWNWIFGQVRVGVWDLER